jgi:hypothetical protein
VDWCRCHSDLLSEQCCGWRTLFAESKAFVRAAIIVPVLAEDNDSRKIILFSKFRQDRGISCHIPTESLNFYRGMATGDVQGNVDRLRLELRSVRYNEEFDIQG